jgi:hypothetical protein
VDDAFDFDTADTPQKSPRGGRRRTRRNMTRSLFRPGYGVCRGIPSEWSEMLGTSDSPPAPSRPASTRASLLLASCFFLRAPPPADSRPDPQRPRSPHPLSYLGEIILQTGPSLLSLPSLPGPTVPLALLSPLFTYLLLRYASGVPPLEKSAEKKWGADPAWRKYTTDTAVLVPWPLGKGRGKME